MKQQTKRGRKPKKLEILIQQPTIEVIPPETLKVLNNQPLLLKKQNPRPLPILKLIQYPIPGLRVNHG